MKISLARLRRADRSVLFFGTRPSNELRRWAGPGSKFTVLDWRRLDRPELTRAAAERSLRAPKARPLILLGSQPPPWASEVLAAVTRTRVVYALCFAERAPSELRESFPIRLGFEEIAGTP